MVKELIDEIKKKLKKFKTKEEKIKYLKKALNETDNEELKELILELIEELEEDLEEIVEKQPIAREEPIKQERIVERKEPEYKPTDRTRETVETFDENKTNVEYSQSSNTQYVGLSRSENMGQNDLAERVRMDLSRKHLLPSRGLIASDDMKNEMRREIKKYFNDNITEDKVENLVTTFTSFKKYESKDTTKGEDIEYHLTG